MFYQFETKVEDFVVAETMAEETAIIKHKVADITKTQATIINHVSFMLDINKCVLVMIKKNN